MFGVQKPKGIRLMKSNELKEYIKAAWRVYGGGFAGTVQAFVTADMSEIYKTETENVFGKGNCVALCVKNGGAVKVI